jgi:tetratricopeptide (TPR) repeat protein
MSADNDSFDFFVSYARSDNASGWITQFIAELLAEHRRWIASDPARPTPRDLHPFFDQHAITTGADWQLYLAHGIAHSRLFLAFLSPNYFASEWCRKEWRAWIDAEIAQHILTAGVRPIYIVEVPGLTGAGQLSDQQLSQQLAELSHLPPRDQDKIRAETPPVLRHLRRRQHTHNQPFCDVHAFFDAGLDALRRADLRRVLHELARDLDHHAALCAQADASRATVPAYNRHFTGRLDELLALRERLIKDDRTGVIYGVHGLGGIGKSELAYAYAHAYASAYPGGRFLLRCEGKTNLRDAVLGQSDFTALFREQISDEERKQPTTYFAALTACLRDRLEQLGHVLLILDNVTDPALLEPEQTDVLTALGPKLHLLATTRLVPPTTGKRNWLTLDRLPDEEGVRLLEKHRPFTDASEEEAARRIVKRLGGFTLVVELVAAWLAKHRDVACQAYMQRLGLEGLEAVDALAEERDVQLRRHNHERRLEAVLCPTLAQLQPTERLAVDYAALLPPDCIAWEWLEVLVGEKFPSVAAACAPGHPDPWGIIRERLTGLSLTSDHSNPELGRMHRLVQEFVQTEPEHDTTKLKEHLIEHALRRCRYLSKNWAEDDARWELEPLTAWAHFLVEQEPDRGGLLEKELGRLLYEAARYRDAEPLLEHVLALAETEHGHDHPAVAAALNNLAQLLQATNRLPEAESLMRRALQIDKQSYGENHPRVAIGLSNLAQLLQATNRLTEAEPMLRRALQIDEQSNGESHPIVAIRLNNLALLLQATNRFAAAEPLLRRALAIDERSFGPEHPEAARTLNSLAMLLRSTNRLGDAEALLRRKLVIDEKCFGSVHPDVATTLNNLATVLQDTNRTMAAEPLLRRALSIWEVTLGEGHPKVAMVLSNLALLLQETNRLAEAEPLHRRALAMAEQSRGPEHPDVALALNNVATLLHAMKRLAEAEPLLCRAVKILLGFMASTRHQHPNLQSFTENYIELLIQMGRSQSEVQAHLNVIGKPFGIQLGGGA